VSIIYRVNGLILILHEWRTVLLGVLLCGVVQAGCCLVDFVMGVYRGLEVVKMHGESNIYKKIEHTRWSENLHVPLGFIISLPPTVQPLNHVTDFP
jgi:hypothetical protein